MLNMKKDYVVLRSLAQYGKESYKRLIKNTNNINPFYKNQNYYDQYNKNIAMVFWKLEKELRKKKIRYGKGFSTLGTKYEVITRERNSGSTASDIFSKNDFFIPEINCLPEEMTYKYEEEFDMEYIKAFLALQDENLVFLMSVFTSTLLHLISYIEKNHEMLIDDIENGKINSSIIVPNEIKSSINESILPNRKRAEELRNIFANKTDEPIIPKIWKKMSMIATFSFGEHSLYEEKLIKYSGKDILYVHQMYVSGKSLIATVFDENQKSYLLSYDSRFF